MAYNNYFPVTYSQYYPQFQQPTSQTLQPMAQQPAQDTGIIWVQGEAGAKSYLVGAGRSVLLMDSESSTFYIKTTDASGMPQPLRVFDYIERAETQSTIESPSQEIDTSQFVTREEFEDRISAMARQNASSQRRAENAKGGNGK